MNESITPILLSLAGVVAILGIAFIFLEILVFPGTWLAGLTGLGLSIAALVLTTECVVADKPEPPAPMGGGGMDPMGGMGGMM